VSSTENRLYREAPLEATFRSDSVGKPGDYLINNFDGILLLA
jgi:hypothetical protein